LNPSALVPYFIAAVCGASHAWIASQFWGFYAISNDLIKWSFASFDSKDYEFLSYLVIYTHDLAVNVLIAVPLAIAVALLRPRRNWKYLWVALVSALLTSYWYLLIEPGALLELVQHSSFFASLIVFVISMPLAYFAVVTLRKSENAA
jgi:hypothetical protein